MSNRQGGRWALWFLVWGALLFSGMVRAKALGFGPVPAWVEAQAVPLTAPTPDREIADGAYVLLFGRQLRIDGGQRVEYTHLAVRVVHARGVESYSTLNLRVNPAFEKLTVHEVRVHRNGQLLNRLEPGQWRTLQRETGLESQMLDGSLSATAVLPDVRVGDVIEYSYSRAGANPVFGGLMSGSFDHRWSMPVARMHARLLWPVDRPLQMRARNQAPAPQRREMGRHVEYRWQADTLDALTVDSQAPSWFDPYPDTQWSEFADWRAVARWAVPLYALPPARPKVKREAERIAREHTDPEQRLLAALRFVQREVRYLGQFIGPQSHAPNPPDLVLVRRFGDCKDKTRLLLALLKELDIPAEAALVNTRRERGIADAQPSPNAFDHVLVRAHLGQRTLWLDPTKAPQNGRTLGELVQADFGLALPVQADSDRLVAMAAKDAQPNRRRIELLIDARAGHDQPAQLQISTRAEGSAADNLRHTLATQAHDELHKRYADFYAQAFPGLRPQGGLDVRDDPEANVLTVVERYRLPQWWERNEKDGRREALVSTALLQEWLQLPSTAQRSAPYGLVHPFEATHVTEVRLAEDFAVTASPWRIEHPAFSLSREETWSDRRTLRLVDTFATRSDAVSADQMPQFIEQLRKARSDLAYSLWHHDRPAVAEVGHGPHWVPLLTLLLAAGAIAWGVLRLLRWDPAPAPERPLAPRGRAGWLLLPPLGMVIGAFLTSKNLLESWPALQTHTWAALTDPARSGHDPAFAPYLLLSLALGMALVAALLLSLWLYASSRSSLPPIYVGALVLMIVCQFVDLAGFAFIPSLAEQADAKTQAESVRGVVTGIIWIAYFRLSGRVADTFVRRRLAVAGALPQTAPHAPAAQQPLV